MLTATALMELAIEQARLGIAAGQSPFGCAIAREGKLISAAHNTVLETNDPTAHAEINAIRRACAATNDPFLTGCVVATTCEPCPMCAAGLHWARVERVHFGASIGDASSAGFNELHFSAVDLLSQGQSTLIISGGLLTEPCRQLFTEWQAQAGRKTY